MSRIAIVAAVVLAVLVALAVALTRGPAGDGRADDAPLLAFDPASVETMTVEHASGARDLVRHGPPDAGGAVSWEVVCAPAPSGEAGPAWPVNPANVRAALRMLADLRPAGPAPRDRSSKDAAAPARTVTLAMSDGSTRRIGFAAASLGGVTLGRVGDSAPRPVDSAIVDGLFSPGPGGWRDRSALPGVGVDASRLTLSWENSSVSLARVGSRWGMTAPVATRADAETVRRALGAITSVVVLQFTENDRSFGGPPRYGFETPRLRVVVETDERSPDNDRGLKTRAARRALTLGTAPGADGKSAFASPSERPEAASLVFTVNPAPLLELPSEPIAYIAATASGALPADVGEIIVERSGGGTKAERLERTLDGWARSGAEAGAQHEPMDAAALGVLDLLCVKKAAAVVLESADGGEAFEPRATIKLLGFQHEPLDEVTFGRFGAGGRPAALERDPLGRRVVRVYAEADTPAMLR